MTAHKHATNMRLYAEDAAETDTPYLLWECRLKGDSTWGGLDSKGPIWNPSIEYRRKPRTIRIGERDVPAPMTTAPEIGQVVYRPTPSSNGDIFSAWTFNRYKEEIAMLKRGMLHDNEEAAIAHAEALILVSGGAL